MCHRFKLANLNWCCQLLPCSDGDKSGSLMTNSSSFTETLQPQKNMQSNHIYVSVGIVGLLHVQVRQYTSTSSLQNGCIFVSPDAWFHAPMLLSADTINILRQRTRLILPSKQGSNWQHQLKQASLYPWHIMTSIPHCWCY